MQNDNYIYAAWAAIKQRCYNPNHPAYKDYGARGITLSDEWLKKPLVFVSYIQEELGERPSAGYSLDRIDNEGNYEPGNLRWASRQVQASNRRRPKRTHFIERTNRPNKTGFRWVKKNGRLYEGWCRVNGTKIFIGKGDKPEEVYELVLKWRRENSLPLPPINGGGDGL